MAAFLKRAWQWPLELRWTAANREKRALPNLRHLGSKINVGCFERERFPLHESPSPPRFPLSFFFLVSHRVRSLRFRFSDRFAASMVARMMRWRPWPPPVQSKKFEVRLVVRRIEGLASLPAPAPAVVEIRWKGPQRMALSALARRSAGTRRNRTREEEVREGGRVDWDEEFFCVCALTAYRDGSGASFHPWEISFAVLTGMIQGSKDKTLVAGTASLNLADFVSAEEKEVQITVPLSVPGAIAESCPTLYLAVSLLELRTVHESQETVQRSEIPVTSSPPSGGSLSSEQDESTILKSGFRKVKIFKDLVSSRKGKRTCPDDENGEGRCNGDDDVTAQDTESTFDDPEEEDRNDTSNCRNSFSYGSLVSANYIGGSLFSEPMINDDNDDLIYYSHRRSDVGCSHVEETTSSMTELPVALTLKRSILPWRKRRLSFKSPKIKGEPLLNKSYGEEGGDDIDFDRRQLSFFDRASLGGKSSEDLAGNEAALSVFGDDQFAVGSWESKEIVSRDANMKLCTQVFFASIDQRSERAAGESACAVLVAVIADWFHSNQDMMPIKCQFDNLIREGSLKWRNLCENQIYLQRFPDKHFDLETILEANICPLSVAPQKSFVGFFHPDSTDDSNSFDFLHGAMSFDNIWDEISRAASNSSDNGTPSIFVVSWNDHFFILKVEDDAYYIIDTLGERLHEGCAQAYILKFNDNTLIQRTPSDNKSDTGKLQDAGTQQVQQDAGTKANELTLGQETAKVCSSDEVVCRGKDSCKEYIKSFLAAIPIRELQGDLKKGLNSTSVYHRLQIEFHYTESSKERSTELLQATEPTLTFPGSAESDSEFSLPTESDPEVSASPLSAVSATEPFSPVGMPAAFFSMTSLNLGVEVV